MNVARRGARTGFVLMEVVLGLMLLVGAAAVLLGGLNSAARAVLQLERQAVAADLACTALSALQMGLLPAVSMGPEPFGDDFPGWEWKIVFSKPELVDRRGRDSEASGVSLREVEVIIRHREGYSGGAGGARSSLAGSDGTTGSRSGAQSAGARTLTYRLKQQLVVGAVGFGRAFEDETASAAGAEGLDDGASDDGDGLDERDGESAEEGGRDEEAGATRRDESERGSDLSGRDSGARNSTRQSARADASQMEDGRDPNLPRELGAFFREPLGDPFANPLDEATRPYSGGYR